MIYDSDDDIIDVASSGPNYVFGIVDELATKMPEILARYLRFDITKLNLTLPSPLGHFVIQTLQFSVRSETFCCSIET